MNKLHIVNIEISIFLLLNQLNVYIKIKPDKNKLIKSDMLEIKSLILIEITRFLYYLPVAELSLLLIQLC